MGFGLHGHFFLLFTDMCSIFWGVRKRERERKRKRERIVNRNREIENRGREAKKEATKVLFCNSCSVLYGTATWCEGWNPGIRHTQ